MLGPCGVSLDGGLAADDLLQDAPRLLADLFEREWARAAQGPKGWESALALAVFSERPLACSELAYMVGMEEETLAQFLARLSCISLDAAGDLPRVVSPQFLEFATTTLSGLRSQATDMLISRLLERPSSPEALQHLPTYLGRAGRHSDVLAFLTPERMVDAVEGCPSLGQPLRLADRGIAPLRTRARGGGARSPRRRLR